MTLLPPFYLDTLVALEEGPDEAGEYRATATGFLAGFDTGQQNEDGDMLFGVFLVTNKHVVEGRETLIAKFNRGDEAARSVLEANRDGAPLWHTHDRYAVAATLMNMNAMKEAGAEVAFVPDSQMLSSDRMKELGVAAGDDVFVLGFPMGMAGVRRKYGVARGGIVARFDDDILSEQDGYLIDSSVFPGNSGGPVVLRPTITAITGTPTIDRAYVIGLVSSYVPYTDVAISQQTRRARITFEENSGLANVVPLEALRELVTPLLPPPTAPKEDTATIVDTGQPDPNEPT